MMTSGRHLADRQELTAASADNNLSGCRLLTVVHDATGNSQTFLRDNVVAYFLLRFFF